MSDKYHHNQIKSVLEHSKRIRMLNRSILMLLLFGIIIIIYNYLNQDDDFVSVSIIDSKYEEAAIDTLDNILEIKNSVISGTDGNNQSKISLIECYFQIKGTGTLKLSAESETNDLSFTGNGKYLSLIHI